MMRNNAIFLDSGFVVDWTVFRDNDNSFLPKKENVKYFLGSLFTPLRQPFLEASQNPINQEVKKNNDNLRWK
jgi:hypothetical protein